MSAVSIIALAIALAALILSLVALIVARDALRKSRGAKKFALEIPGILAERDARMWARFNV